MVTRPFVLISLAFALSGCRGKEPPPKTETTVEPTAAAPATPVAVGHGELLSGPSTYAVIVGVLDFEDPGVAGWSKERRKDQALYDALRARGVPADHMALLLDEEARHATVLAAVERVSEQAGPGSTLLFYYAGHGTRGKQGRPYFVAYDSLSADMASTGIAVSKVGGAVREHFRGDRVLFMADACYSGTLGEAVAEVVRPRKDGREVIAASLTSADASNLSTNNWTFTQTILDGLTGDGLMDHDGDRTISLGELSAAVADAMKYREKQRHGFVSRGIDEKVAVSKVKRTSAGDAPVGRYVLAPRPEHGSKDVAQIRAVRGHERTVRFYDYNHATDRKTAASELTPITFERHPVGTALRVFWGNKLWDAKVLEVEGDFHFITYPGWGPEWNEWVMSDRIAIGPGEGTTDAIADREVVEVEWRGKWWPARVREQRGGRYLIRYVGYGPEWDEWVTDARLRRAGQP